jgi:hypothetical protein
MSKTSRISEVGTNSTHRAEKICSPPLEENNGQASARDSGMDGLDVGHLNGEMMKGLLDEDFGPDEWDFKLGPCRKNSSTSVGRKNGSKLKSKHKRLSI